MALRMLRAEVVREEIRKARELTDKPFGVNIMLLSPSAEEIAQLVIEEKVPVITTGAGNPEKYMAAWKDAGIKVIPVVASVALAKRNTRSSVTARMLSWRKAVKPAATSASRRP